MNESSLRFLFPSDFLFGWVCFSLKFYSWARNKTSLQKNFVRENWNVDHLRLNVAFPSLLLENSVRFQGRKY